MRTGRATLTNASSPMKPLSPIAKVAHGSRWPPPPTTTSSADQKPAPTNARRHASRKRAAEERELAGRERLGALDADALVDRDAVLEHDPRRDDDRALADRHALADAGAVGSVRVALLLGGERRERARVGAERGEEALVERARALVEGKQRRQRDVLGREPGKERVALLRFRCDRDQQRLDVLGGDEAAASRSARGRCRAARRAAAALRVTFAGPDGSGAASSALSRLGGGDLGVLLVRARRSRRRARPRRPTRRAGRACRRRALDLDRGLRGLDDAHGLALAHLDPVCHEPFASSADSRVRVLSREDDLEQRPQLLAAASASTACTTSSTPGSIASSSGRAAGMIPSCAATRRTGAAQVVPASLLHAGGDLGADAAGERPLLDGDEGCRCGRPTRAPDRGRAGAAGRARRPR